MFKSYLTIAWRNLQRGKMYSVINIAGLAAGMSVALLIGLWTWDELSFDSYFENRQSLARVMVLQTHEGVTYAGGTVQMPLGDALRTGYPAEFKAVSLASGNRNMVVSVNDKRLNADGMWVQADFPSMFTLSMRAGSRGVLEDPSTVLISSSLATALFGDSDAVNQPIRIDNRFDLVVGGVYEDFPFNTTFYNTRALLPWDNQENALNSISDWMNHCGQLFVQLGDQASIAAVNGKIRSVPTSHITPWKEEAMLQTFDRLHLYNRFENGKEAGGRIDVVWLIAVIGIFVLLLACINFMNLATARSERRAREVGIRKSVGSYRSQIVGQFLTESILFAGLALTVSLAIAQLSLPLFNALADKHISVPWQNPTFWLIVTGFTLLTGIVSGSYPAFYLSAFRPVKVLKGVFRSGRFAALPRKVLVVTQFTVSVALVIGTAIVLQQIQHAKARPAGFTRDGLVTVWMNTPDLRMHADAIRHELLQEGLIHSMALSSMSPAHFSNNNGMEWRGKDPAQVVMFRNVGVTPDYGKTVGWKVREGRDFSADLPGDSSAMMVNEEAAKVMGFENPVGEVVRFRGKEYRIIGVTEDMLTQSPYEPAEPSFFITDDRMTVMVMRLSEAMPVRDALAGAGRIFRKYNPESPFDFQFVDQAFARKFSNEERISSLAALFAILAVLISCLGLFGLASFVAEQRTKEIGIRKVLGASVSNLWRMLSREFVALVAASCVIAIPVSALFMKGWLEQFQYRIELSWPVFALAALGAVTVTLVTVSFQAIRAAVANPVSSLRSE
jgi:predicted permease